MTLVFTSSFKDEAAPGDILQVGCHRLLVYKSLISFLANACSGADSGEVHTRVMEVESPLIHTLCTSQFISEKTDSFTEEFLEAVDLDTVFDT